MGYRVGSMNIAEIDVEAAELTADKKKQLLARFAFELTVVARATYLPGSEEVSAPRQLRAVNEIQHRVTSALVQSLGGGKDENWIWPVVADLAYAAGIASEVADAGSRALRSITGPN
jgi:hypothetical protein